MMVRGLIIGPMILAASVTHAIAQDIPAGEAAFRKCQICHDVGEAAKNKLGPELNGLDGRKAGTAEGYAYSDSNKNSGIVWSEATLKEYLADPQAKMPGTKMIFSDKNEKEVADLWAYLKRFGADGKKKAQ
jgi:cytochrome c